MRRLDNGHWTNLDWLGSQIGEVGRRSWNRLAPTPFARAYRAVRPYTMSSCARLRGLYEAVARVDATGVAGDLVECGAARGGSAALLGLASRTTGEARRLWVFDTFEGLPPPTRDDPDWEIASRFTGQCRGEIAEVSGLFERLGILDRCQLVKGLFQNTLPVSAVKTIAVLHVDGDWYESVKVCLETLYDRVPPGGVVQIDDYGHWQGARKAVDEFLRARGLQIPLRRLDYTGRQWIKP